MEFPANDAKLIETLALQTIALGTALNAVITENPQLMWKVMAMSENAKEILLATNLSDEQIRKISSLLAQYATPPSR